MVRQLCPQEAGVYGMLDPAGTLIYVGKAKSIRRRLLSYLLSEPADPKAGRIIDHTAWLLWETTPHELAALVRELELIRRFRPRFNVQGQPGRFRRVFVCLGREGAPRAFVATRPGSGAKSVFGPVRSKRILHEAVRQVNTWFRLRDCPDRVPMMFAEQLTLLDQSQSPLCPRHELGTCPAPCASGCSRRAYFENVAAAAAFLDGQKVQLLNHLRDAIVSAAENCQFERAANLRDAWQPLAWLERELAGVRNARRIYSFVYPVLGAAARRHWFLIRAGEIVDFFTEPRHQRSAIKALDRLERVFGLDANSPRKTDAVTQEFAREDPEAVALTVAWFRRYPDELNRTLAPAAGAAVCRQLISQRHAVLGVSTA
jgi:excinuclease ABC subunit C